MFNPTDALNEELQVLRQSYATRLPQKLERLEQTWQKLQTGEWNKAFLKEFYLQVHTIGGTGGTYGLAELSAAAGKLEIVLKGLMKTEATPDETERAEISKLLAAIINEGKELKE